MGLLLLALTGCPKPVVGTETTPDTTPDSGPTVDSGTTLSPFCAAYSPSRKVGENTSELPELSGLVASRRHAGIFWAHNDSGNPLELFAIRESGGVAAKIPLKERVVDRKYDPLTWLGAKIGRRPHP